MERTEGNSLDSGVISLYDWWETAESLRLVSELESHPQTKFIQGWPKKKHSGEGGGDHAYQEAQSLPFPVLSQLPLARTLLSNFPSTPWKPPGSWWFPPDHEGWQLSGTLQRILQTLCWNTPWRLFQMGKLKIGGEKRFVQGHLAHS